MEASKSPEIFQDEINEMFQGLNFICAFINDLLVCMTSDCTNHLTNMEQVLIESK